MGNHIDEHPSFKSEFVLHTGTVGIHHVFQCVKAFEFQNDLIAECDKEIEKILLEMIAVKNEGVIPELEKVKRKKNYGGDFKSILI